MMRSAQSLHVLFLICLLLEGCSGGDSVECDDNNPCAGGYLCMSGVCEKVCADADDCDVGEACLNETCQAYEQVCGEDIPCAAGWFCAESGQCEPLGRLGDVCSESEGCQSGFCVDGVCCGSECDGVCESCLASMTGEATGICNLVVVGSDPDSECAGALACDGSGACFAGAEGEVCSENYECISEFCVDGYCSPPPCGDGVVGNGEDCDDGNTVDDGNGCSESCTANNVCGNNIIEGAIEACDDGNAEDGDYCSADCTVVTGSCGDGSIQTNEACDDGNTVDDGDGCSETCQSNSVCGNGTLESLTEVCDDGNEVDGDYCSAACDEVTGSCGDSVLQTNEDCDDGNSADDGNGCSAVCQKNAFCGNGATESLYEDCDDGNVVNDGNGCDTNCMRAGACGDGAIESLFEVCDDSNTADGDYCAGDCTAVTGSCADGSVQTNEACDDGNTNNGDYCSDDCLTSFGECGDGVVQFFEECDDGGTLAGNGCNGLCEVEPGWVCSGTPSACTRVVYVKPFAFGSGSGDSWENAMTSLEDALDLAEAAIAGSAELSLVEVWVAAGTYYPSELASAGDSRSATFKLRSGVVVLGGFSGFEFERRDRAVQDNPTILSGDINQSNSKSGNAYHVVDGSGADDSAVLDGFIIEQGSASGDCGDCDAVIGGGIFVNNGSPNFANLVVRNNEATTVLGYGGAVAVTGGGNTRFINVLIYDNEAYNGCGMRVVESEVTLYNVTMSDNDCLQPNGAAVLRIGGTIRSYNTIIANHGGNTLLDQLNAYGSNDLFRHSLIPGIAEGSSTGNINALPSFVNASTGDYRLTSTSRGVDEGNYLHLQLLGDPWDSDGNGTYLGLFPLDVTGQDRFEGNEVDIGAYEYR